MLQQQAQGEQDEDAVLVLAYLLEKEKGVRRTEGTGCQKWLIVLGSGSRVLVTCR